MAEPAGPAVGTDAPSFTATLARPGGHVEEVPLTSLLADRPVLLVFHPTGFDLESLNDGGTIREFVWFTFDERVQVVGVSRAKPCTHQRIIDHLDLEYPFYTDRSLSAAAAYGVRYRAWGLAPRARQACFFIDGNGVVRYRWVADESRASRRDLPALNPLYETVRDVVGEPEWETFGFA